MDVVALVRDFILDWPAERSLPDNDGVALVGHIDLTGDYLNQIQADLPPAYFAEFLTHLASDIERRRRELAEK